ncbi:hypothetical protein B0H15DRAFT_971185 [Mycena belliarum]|uniref:Uncharacterized protein n=1 Tax=Mycena belliarum TaxID=1033014 RepID=A0AAD6UB13_9AGAR|nr:hypothetical protein B0H15DRAFT_971185 [Mycena belliae]
MTTRRRLLMGMDALVEHFNNLGDRKLPKAPIDPTAQRRGASSGGKNLDSTRKIMSDAALRPRPLRSPHTLLFGTSTNNPNVPCLAREPQVPNINEDDKPEELATQDKERHLSVLRLPLPAPRAAQPAAPADEKQRRQSRLLLDLAVIDLDAIELDDGNDCKAEREGKERERWSPKSTPKLKGRDKCRPSGAATRNLGAAHACSAVQTCTTTNTVTEEAHPLLSTPQPASRKDPAQRASAPACAIVGGGGNSECARIWDRSAAQDAKAYISVLPDDDNDEDGEESDV